MPEYIDRVVSLNVEHQPLMRDGLAWLDAQAQTRFSRDFQALDEAQQISILQPLSDEVDRLQREAQRRRFRTEAKGRLVYYVAVTDRTTPAPPSVAGPSSATNTAPAMPVRLVPPGQEPDCRRVLHVAGRAARGAGLHGQHRAGQLPGLHSARALDAFSDTETITMISKRTRLAKAS